jgi:hypothetical protein
VKTIAPVQGLDSHLILSVPMLSRILQNQPLVLHTGMMMMIVIMTVAIMLAVMMMIIITVLQAITKIYIKIWCWGYWKYITGPH